MKCRVRSLEAKVRTLRAERDAALSGEVYASMRSGCEKMLDDQKRAYEKKIQERENSTPGR